MFPVRSQTRPSSMAVSLSATNSRPGSGTVHVPSKDPGTVSIVMFQVSITSTR